MSQINPFQNSILQAPMVQHEQSAEKVREVRRAAERTKNSALDEDQLEHQVESSEELAPVHEDQQHERRFKQSRHRDHKEDDSEDGDSPSHIDVKA